MNRERFEQSFPTTQEHWRSIGLGASLVILTVLAYWPALRGGFIWDDDQHLTANPCIIGPLGLKEIWTTTSAVYYPLVLTSFWIQHAIWGLNPLYFHLINVLMQALNAVLLWRVLLRLNIPGAWLGAALWALHPVQVESVAWITELKNTQSCAFYLLAILFFLRWRGLAGTTEKTSGVFDYLIAILFGVLAILSKTSTVILPVVLALCWWWKDRTWHWRNTIRLLPFFTVSALASAWTVWEQKFHSRAQGVEWAQSALERFAIAGKAVWFYVGKLLWPHPLIFIYPHWTVDASRAISFLPVSAAIFVSVCLWLGRNHKQLRPAFFGFSYFLISLFPALSFFNVYFFRYSFVADHFQYLASMGLLALVAAALSQLPKPAQILSVALLPVLLALTWQQTKIYHDDETLWKDTLAKNPGCWMAHLNLGSIRREQGRVTEAEAEYSEALKLKPDFAEALSGLGICRAREGQLDDAINYFEAALKNNPNYGPAYYNLGNALRVQGKTGEAILAYEAALRAGMGDLSGVHNNLAVLLSQSGRPEEAIAHYQEALRLNPKSMRTYINLARAFLQVHREGEAIETLKEALRVNPGYTEARQLLRQLGIGLD